MKKLYAQFYINTNDPIPDKSLLIYVFNAGTGESIESTKHSAVDVVRWMRANPLGKVEYKWQ